MKKIIALILLSFSLQSQTLIKYKQMENPATTSVNLGSNTLNAGTVNANSLTTTGNVLITNTLTSVPLLSITSGTNLAFLLNDGTSFALGTDNAIPTEIYYSNQLKLKLNNNQFRFSDGVNAFFGTTTGSKIGETTSQKLAFWNSTPIVQPVNTVAINDVLVNTGLRASGGISNFSSGITTTAGFTATTSSKLTSTLNTEGNTTWNTNQTNTLTTGNSGTVAVLSDAYFPVTFAPNLFSPADNKGYYIGNTFYPPNLFASQQGTVNIPFNSTLVWWQFNYVVSGVVASAETSTLVLRVNGVDTQTLSTSITFSNATTYGGFSGTVSDNYSANDKIDMRLYTPNFATNPTSVYLSILLGYVRRQ